MEESSKIRCGAAASCEDNAFFAAHQPNRLKSRGHADLHPSDSTHRAQVTPNRTTAAADVVKTVCPSPNNRKTINTLRAYSVVVPDELVTSQGFLEDAFRYHDVRAVRERQNNNKLSGAQSNGHATMIPNTYEARIHLKRNKVRTTTTAFYCIGKTLNRTHKNISTCTTLLAKHSNRDIHSSASD